MTVERLSRMGQAAWRLTQEFGYSILALRFNAKAPKRGTNGVTGASSHPDFIFEIDERYRGRYNIGVACGPIFVEDFDDFGTLETYVKRFGIRPPTVTVLTPRPGMHRYHCARNIGHLSRNTAGRFGKGFDTRGFGGYVVSPPSEIDGVAYRYTDGCAPWEIDLAPLPDNVVAALQMEVRSTPATHVLVLPTPADDVTERCARYMAKMPPLRDGEGRNRSAYGLAAFVLHTLNQTIADAWTAVHAWNARNWEPLTNDRLHTIILNASMYGKAVS